MQAKSFRYFLPALTIYCTGVNAQDLEPRSYTNVPIDQTFVVVGGVYSDGDLSPTATSPLQDAELTLEAAVVGFAHTFALAGKSAKIDMAATRQCMEGSASFRGEHVEGRRCGYGDPKVRLSWNFYGAPALTLQDYSNWQPGLVIGASLQASVPVGSYSQEYLVNFGANRWMLRPGIGMSWRSGVWHLDLIGSVRFFEDNDDFFEGLKQEQDPVYSMQSHLVYNLRKGRWVSLNLNFFAGGDTKYNGASADNRMENSRFGITWSTPLTRHQSIKLYASTGVITRIGNDADSYGLAWQYRF
jgi:Putative MetA-pathway of phenol degradation